MATDPNFSSQFPRNDAHRELDTSKFVAVAGQTVVSIEQTGNGARMDTEGGAWVTVNGSDWASFPAELPRAGDTSPSATIDNWILFFSGNDWYYIFDTRTLR
jgi:hypothetical protein